jgi:uncharacterized protein YndB with AHSA1/START domain
MAVEQLQKGTTSVWSDADKKELKVERVFDAPRDLVWKAWTDPDQLAAWWGPRGWATTNYKFEFKPGGMWHYCMRGPDGMESWGRGIFKEIVAPERFSYVDEFSNPDGGVDENMPGSIFIENVFEDLGGSKTKLVSRSELQSAEQLKSLVEMGMLQGLTETWDRLAEFLAKA